MKKTVLKTIVACLLTINGFATANFVYHEPTLNSPGGCGTYLSSINPTYLTGCTIEFVIDYQYFTNRARIYYTTDGSNPSGAFGVPSGTTQVISASYYCAYDNGNGDVDVVRGTIPSLPYGTVVKYIVSAWHSGGGLEIFGSSGTNTSSATATIFNYIVTAPLPLKLVNFSGKKSNNSVQLSWITEQEINVDHYEVYRSADGTQFHSIATKAAVGNTALATTYSIDDNNALKGNNFYKLRIIDRDGKFTWSGVIKIAFEMQANATIFASKNTLHVAMAAPDKENYTVRVINNSGQVVGTYTIGQTFSGQQHLINLPSNLQKGIYHVNISSSSNLFRKSLFIE